jgi:hypothetical protein
MKILLLFFLAITSSLFVPESRASCSKKRCEELGVCAEVFQHFDFEGESKCVFPLGIDWNRDCFTLPDWWQDYGSPTARVSSVRTHGKCVKLWSGTNCTGDYVAVKTRPDLTKVNFNDKTRSISTCLRKDEVSGASFKTCTDIQLFIGNNLIFQQKKNMVSEIAGKLKDSSKFLLVATPLTVFYPVIDAMQLLVSISNDIMSLNRDDVLMDNIDLRITRQMVNEARNRIAYWAEELKMLNETSAPVNGSEYQRVVRNSYDDMSILLKSFGSGLMEQPLVSSELIVFFPLAFYPLMQMKLLLDPKRKNKICRQGEELLNLLHVYEKNATEARINLLRETLYVNAFDYLTHEPVFIGGSYASVSETNRLRPMLNVCHRDWIISIRNGMNEFFRESLKSARYWMKLLNCSVKKEEDEDENTIPEENERRKKDKDDDDSDEESDHEH